MSINWFELFIFQWIWRINLSDWSLFGHDGWTGKLSNRWLTYFKASLWRELRGTWSSLLWNGRHMGLSRRASQINIAYISTFLLVNLAEIRIQILNFCHESILFKLHEHLFLDCTLILVWKLLKGVLVILVLFLKFTNIVVQLLFFLLNTSVVDFLKISLFTKFVVSWAGLLSDDPCLIDLFLKLGEDVWELDVILIDLWNLRHLLQI